MYDKSVRSCSSSNLTHFHPLSVEKNKLSFIPRREIAALTGSAQGAAQGHFGDLIGQAQAHLTQCDSTSCGPGSPVYPRVRARVEWLSKRLCAGGPRFTALRPPAAPLPTLPPPPPPSPPPPPRRPRAPTRRRRAAGPLCVSAPRFLMAHRPRSPLPHRPSFSGASGRRGDSRPPAAVFPAGGGRWRAAAGLATGGSPLSRLLPSPLLPNLIFLPPSPAPPRCRGRRRRRLPRPGAGGGVLLLGRLPAAPRSLVASHRPTSLPVVPSVPPLPPLASGRPPVALVRVGGGQRRAAAGLAAPAPSPPSLCGCS